MLKWKFLFIPVTKKEFFFCFLIRLLILRMNHWTCLTRANEFRQRETSRIPDNEKSRSFFYKVETSYTENHWFDAFQENWPLNEEIDESKRKFHNFLSILLSTKTKEINLLKLSIPSTFSRGIQKNCIFKNSLFDSTIMLLIYIQFPR